MKNQNESLLTIFTPTFNRAHTLPRTYESLKKQKCKDFVWLIIDDGSTDETAELVNKWICEEKDFLIRYVFKENGGMHSAHNIAYRNIDTLLNTCIDSDDELAENAISMILHKWEEIKDLNYAGIIALDADMKTGEIIGKGFSDSLVETTLSGYYNAGGSGDKKLVYRTDVINQYPEYPEFPGEKYVSLSYKYLLIDQDYKLAVLNEVLCNVEYQSDGSSKSMYKQYLSNPKGFAFWRTIKMKYDPSIKRRIVDCIHYCSSAEIGEIKDYIRKSPYPFLTILCTPLGHLLTIYIRKKVGNV